MEALRREIELRMKASVAGGQTVSSEVSRHDRIVAAVVDHLCYWCVVCAV